MAKTQLPITPVTVAPAPVIDEKTLVLKDLRDLWQEIYNTNVFSYGLKPQIHNDWVVRLAEIINKLDPKP